MMIPEVFWNVDDNGTDETPVPTMPPQEEVNEFKSYDIPANGEIVIDYEVPDIDFYEMNYKVSTVTKRHR